MLHGIEIRTSPLIVDSEEREVPRSWYERLFSRPWRPWQATRLEVFNVPSKRVVLIGRIAYVHPDALAQLSKTLRVADYGQQMDRGPWRDGNSLVGHRAYRA